MEFLTQTFS